MPEIVWVDIKVSKVNLQSFNGAVRIDGFYSDDDLRRHVLVATAELGKVFEVYYSTFGVSSVLIDNPGVIANDIAGFYSPNDKARHYVKQSALTAVGADGVLSEVKYAPYPPDGQGLRLNPYGDPPSRISALYNLKTHVWHVIFLLNGFSIQEVVYNKKLKTPDHFNTGIVLSSDPPTPYIDVAGFFTSDDDYKHAITLAADGDLFEIYWLTNDDETKPFTLEELGSFTQRVGTAYRKCSWRRHRRSGFLCGRGAIQP